MPLRIVLSTGENYTVDVADGREENDRVREILHGGGEWLEIAPQSWVRRDAIVKIDVTDASRSVGFS
jgi:hypothetical protein